MKDSLIPFALNAAQLHDMAIEKWRGGQTLEALGFMRRALDMEPDNLVTLCGEGEWFVGSRGGAADHAAMKCSTRGYVTHLSFKPFDIGEAMPFSQDYAILVANSMQRAKKSEGAKDQFNAKVAASDVALLLLKKQYPQYNFKKHKGYGTKEHTELILKHGVSEVHRPSFLKKLLGDK